MYQIANLYELKGDMGQAVEWYFQVIGLIPTDPVILQKMGSIYDAEGDRQGRPAATRRNGLFGRTISKEH